MKGHLISQLRKAAKDRKAFLLHCWYLIFSGVCQQFLLASTTVEQLWGFSAFILQGLDAEKSRFPATSEKQIITGVYAESFIVFFRL